MIASHGHRGIQKQPAIPDSFSPNTLKQFPFILKPKNIKTLLIMTSNQPGPYIPSESIASQLEKPKDQPQTLKKEHLEAQPGPVILSEEQAAKLGPPLSKEELKEKAQEMNQ